LKKALALTDSKISKNRRILWSKL